jgi:hypothetical protein
MNGGNKRQSCSNPGNKRGNTTYLLVYTYEVILLVCVDTRTSNASANNRPSTISKPKSISDRELKLQHLAADQHKFAGLHLIDLSFCEQAGARTRYGLFS